MACELVGGLAKFVGRVSVLCSTRGEQLPFKDSILGLEVRLRRGSGAQGLGGAAEVLIAWGLGGAAEVLIAWQRRQPPHSGHSAQN